MATVGDRSLVFSTAQEKPAAGREGGQKHWRERSCDVEGLVSKGVERDNRNGGLGGRKLLT